MKGKILCILSILLTQLAVNAKINQEGMYAVNSSTSKPDQWAVKTLTAQNPETFRAEWQPELVFEGECEQTENLMQVAACRSYTLNDITYTRSGIYHDTLSNAAGCDSLITLDLTILEPAESKAQITSCENYEFGQRLLTRSGLYYDTLSTAGGCDSLVILDLTIMPTVNTQLSKRLCKNESVQFGEQLISEAGQYRRVLTSSAECDSIVTLTVTKIEIDTEVIVGNTVLVAAAEDLAYIWLDCDNDRKIIQGAFKRGFNPPASGNYAVMMSNGRCLDTTACVSYTLREPAVQTAEKFGIKMFPNPGYGGLTIDLGGLYKNVDITVRDLTGRTVWQHRYHQTQLIETEITGGQGIYLIEVTAEGLESQVLRFSKLE